jgi:cation transport ATPase
MDHDMSDPKMARAMERDMRKRFFVALALAIPTVLYSPLGTDFFGIDLPSGIGRNWRAFIFSTPVVLWAGWIFIGGAYHSLRRLSLNMSVLIATGVLAAYPSSVFLTVIGEEDTFYEAAAMLVTFVLFGHWMEMASRRGTTDALRALFDLVPPRAKVIRDGEEVEILSSEVLVGEVDGRHIFVGNRKLLADRGIPVDDLQEKASEPAAAGRTPMFVAIDGAVAGIVAVADTVKPHAKAAVRALTELGIEPAMITGDNRRTAEAVARELGIARVFADVLRRTRRATSESFRTRAALLLWWGTG